MIATWFTFITEDDYLKSFQLRLSERKCHSYCLVFPLRSRVGRPTRTNVSSESDSQLVHAPFFNFRFATHTLCKFVNILSIQMQPERIRLESTSLRRPLANEFRRRPIGKHPVLVGSLAVRKT